VARQQIERLPSLIVELDPFAGSRPLKVKPVL
jgi:hypothetical protein